jgi:hypothetical protein
VLTNKGNGTFTLSQTLTVGNSPNSVAAADVNGDGKVDLISANSGTNTLTVLTNNGSGIFKSNATYVVGISVGGVIAADVNGDSNVDLICHTNNGYANNGLTVLTNNGKGIFELNGATYTLGSGSFPPIATVDVNNDGKC